MRPKSNKQKPVGTHLGHSDSARDARRAERAEREQSARGKRGKPEFPYQGPMSDAEREAFSQSEWYQEWAALLADPVTPVPAKSNRNGRIDNGH